MGGDRARKAQITGKSLFESFASSTARASEARRHEVLVAVANPETIGGLISLAAGPCRPGDTLAPLRVVPVPRSASLAAAQREAATAPRFRDLMRLAAKHADKADVNVEPILLAAHDVAAGIIEVACNRPGTRLLVLGWPGSGGQSNLRASVCENVIRNVNCDVAVLLNRDLDHVRRILVTVGGGPHARLGLRLAADLVEGRTVELTALRVVSETPTDVASEETVIKRLIHEEMERGNAALAFSPRVTRSESVVKGILDEASRDCDLLVVGASEEGFLRNWFFGSIPDTVARSVSCSMLLVHKYEVSPVSWLRRVARRVLGSRRQIAQRLQGR